MEATARPEVNVTPLIDVVLVLLIIFMVVTPILEQEDVKLPRGPAAADLETGVPTSTLAVRLDGTLSLDRRPLAGAELEGALKEIRELEPGRRLLVSADRGLSYGGLKAALFACSAAGFEGVVLRAERGDLVTPPAAP